MVSYIKENSSVFWIVIYKWPVYVMFWEPVFGRLFPPSTAKVSRNQKLMSTWFVYFPTTVNMITDWKKTENR